MISTSRYRYLIAFGLLVVLSGCQGSDSNTTAIAPATRDVVATTFYPTTWIAKQLLRDLVPVECYLPADQNPAAWAPSSDAIGRYQTAGLIVINGAGFEKWVSTATLPTSRIVDSTAELAEPFIVFEDAITHQHGPSGDASNAGIDGHTWLDPIITKHQAARIAAAATRAWPQHAAAIEANLQALNEKLDALDKRFKAATPGLKNFNLLCTDPAYNYLARRYGWNMECLNIDSASQLTEQQLATIAQSRKQRRIMVVWSSQPSNDNIKKLAVADVASIVFPPMATKPTDSDYLSVMNGVLDRFALLAP